MEWDIEVVFIYVVVEVLKDMGYDVKMIFLDNVIMWEFVVKGEIDVMVGVWLLGIYVE